MDLGTGKVEGRWIREGDKKIYLHENIPHHLIDFISPKDDYNVSHFKKDAKKKITEILQREKMPILCGGTGFWILSLIDNLNLPEVKPNQKLRNELEKKSNEELLEELQNIDLERADSVDSKNKIRLIRAIEIAKKLGKVPKVEMFPKKSPFFEFENQEIPFIQIGINWPIEKLSEKIKNRLDDRFQAGMIEEIKMLQKKYQISLEKIQSFGLAYHWIPEFIKGNISKKELQEKVYFAERGYAKRQKTWFKRDKRIIWENDIEKIIELIEK
jgi:tRNA dimethylallyltransferase